MKMKVRIESGEILVNAEYNSAFVKKARQLQGKWKSPNWAFPEDNREEIKALLIDTYGCADILEGENEQKVTVEIALDEYGGEENNELRFGNILLASRFGRDSYVKLADNVMVVSGDFRSRGGSVRNPTVSAEPNTILRVKNVPLQIYEREKNKGGVRLVSDIDINALTEEKERLLVRIAEIDAILAKNDNFTEGK